MVMKLGRRIASDEMMQEDTEGFAGAEEIMPVDLRRSVLPPSIVLLEWRIACAHPRARIESARGQDAIDKRGRAW